MVAQGPDLPIHLGSMPLAVKAVIRPGPTVAARRRLHPQRSLLRREPPARRQRRDAGLPRGHAARLRVRARPLAGHRERHARAATAPPPRSSARACACPRCGSARRASPTPTWRASSSPTSAPPTSGGATCAPRWRPTSAASPARTSWRAKHGAERLLAIMQEVMDYSERMMRGMLAAAARRHRGLRGLLRRRRHHRGRRQGGPHVPHPHARDQAGRPPHRGLRGDGPAGPGPHERAPRRHRLRHLRRRSRWSPIPATSSPPELRLLAARSSFAPSRARW